MSERANTILVIDDNKVIRQLATTLLAKKNYTVITAENGSQGIEMALSHNPHIILLDVVMADLDGYEVCKRLKSDSRTQDIPVIMVTGKTESIDKIRGFELGAADYVTKPFDHGELQARVATQLKMKHLWDELQEKNRQLQENVRRDGLTNLYNNKHFHDCIVEEFNRAVRYKLSLSCAILDLDHFKQVNDTYGHLAGDDVLKMVAQLLLKSIRDVDFAARYGGEEFALLFPHTDLQKAHIVCERIRARISAEIFSWDGIEIKITASLGISGIPDDNPRTPQELIKAADRWLYTAKAEGRNMVRLPNPS